METRKEKKKFRWDGAYAYFLNYVSNKKLNQHFPEKVRWKEIRISQTWKMCDVVDSDTIGVGAHICLGSIIRTDDGFLHVNSNNMMENEYWVHKLMKSVFQKKLSWI